MRNFTINPARIIINETLQQVRNDPRNSPVQIAGSTQATGGTTYTTDGDTGVVTTLHSFILGLDIIADPGAII